MKFFYLLSFLIFSSFFNATAQNFNGQWKGGFNEDSYGYAGLGGDGIDYVLELETKGSDVSGYSYTYFREGPKRYYTICKLRGTVNRATKDIVVTEIERVKYNTPPNFQNCFQTHKLHYVHDSADVEVLRGSWMPAPNQTGNCGYGTTVLSRHVVKKLPLGIASNQKKTETQQAPKKEVAKNKRNYHKPTNPQPKVKPQPEIERPSEIANALPKIEMESPAIVSRRLPSVRARRTDIIKTIPIERATFKLDFYDNGTIDGDSISVFYNGREVLSHQRLSDRPLTLTLALDDPSGENVVTMYAENLGTIPPNTALMIVTDGDKRHEVRITSDTEKSGSVVFIHSKSE